MVRTKEKFIEKASKIHNNKYSYSNFIYVNSRAKGIIICHIHGEFLQTSANHLSGQGCPKCSLIKVADKKRLTFNNFVKRANVIHNNKYNYSKLIYVNAKSKGIIICPTHGEFSQALWSHLKGCGCPMCAKNYKKTKEVFIQQVIGIHGKKYDYSKFIYVNDSSKGIIICPIHGEFLQTPEHHLRGYGCNDCGYKIVSAKLRKSKKDFLKQVGIIHNNKYNYSKFIYVNDKTKGIIICPIHGEFLQTPGHHLRGHGCSKCSSGVSRKSQQWLDELNIPKKFREKSLVINNIFLRADALDEKNKIVYEFYGDFWHGNPKIYDKNSINVVNKKTFGELYINTMRREKLIKTAGFKVIYIWESDFNL